MDRLCLALGTKVRPFITVHYDRVRMHMSGMEYDLDPAEAVAIAMDLHIAAKAASANATNAERIRRELSEKLLKEGI